MSHQPTAEDCRIAMDCIAQACIDENLVDEGERLRLFLEQSGSAPRTVALLNIWIRSQRGDLRDSLRACDALAESEPESPEVLTLLAVLRYSCQEPSWRSVAERLMELGETGAECRKIAESLLDGSFGRKRKTSSGESTEPAQGAEDKAQAPAALHAFDYSLHGNFMRG